MACRICGHIFPGAEFVDICSCCDDATPTTTIHTPSFLRGVITGALIAAGIACAIAAGVRAG